MTPFGEKLRAIRAERNLSLQRMAEDLGISAAYLSALEHGHRGKPNRLRVMQICAYLNIIWDDADELDALARRSDPRVVVDSSGLSPLATELANRLAERIRQLPEPTLQRLLDILDE